MSDIGTILRSPLLAAAAILSSCLATEGRTFEEEIRWKRLPGFRTHHVQNLRLERQCLVLSLDGELSSVTWRQGAWRTYSLFQP
jgi:hypothetical protein